MAALKQPKFKKLRYGLTPKQTKIIAPFVVVLFAVGSFGIAIYSDMRSAGTTYEHNLEDPTPIDELDGNSVNILAMAYDSYSDGNEKFTNAIEQHANADTTMLVHISSDRKSVEVVSIARDLLVTIPDCNVTGDKIVPGRSNAMFNTAFGFAYIEGGDIKSGASCAAKTVEEITGVKIDYTAVVDYSGFFDMVEALGGVDICIPQKIGPIYYAGSLQLDAGFQKITAWQATQYGRARLGIDDGSDISRMKRQQKLMGAIARDALSKANFAEVNKFYKFLKALTRSIDSSMNFETMLGLAFSLSNISMENIAFFTAPIGAAPSDPNRLVLLASAEDMWDLLRNDQPLFSLSEPTDTSSTGTATIPPEISASGDPDAPVESPPASSASSSPAAESPAEPSITDSFNPQHVDEPSVCTTG